MGLLKDYEILVEAVDRYEKLCEKVQGQTDKLIYEYKKHIVESKLEIEMLKRENNMMKYVIEKQNNLLDELNEKGIIKSVEENDYLLSRHINFFKKYFKK